MRAVLDTNVALSALLWGGVPEQLIELAGEGRVELFTSNLLLAELAGILDRTMFAGKLLEKGVLGQEIVARYAQVAQIVESASISPVVLRDPPDDAVLACALTAQVDMIVTGDRHLLNLKNFQRIPILDPTAALSRIQNQVIPR